MPDTHSASHLLRLWYAAHACHAVVRSNINQRGQIVFLAFIQCGAKVGTGHGAVQVAGGKHHQKTANQNPSCQSACNGVDGNVHKQARPALQRQSLSIPCNRWCYGLSFLQTVAATVACWQTRFFEAEENQKKMPGRTLKRIHQIITTQGLLNPARCPVLIH